MYLQYNDEAAHYVAYGSQSTHWAVLTEVSFWLTGNLQFNVDSSFAEEGTFDLESLPEIHIYRHLRTVVSVLDWYLT